MTDTPWQLRIFKKSLKKKEKIRILENILADNPDRTALDLGCAQGTLSYFIRRKGGFWVSTDQDFVNLQSSRTLLEDNLVQMPPGILPFRSSSFDTVACLDYLEHIDNDAECLTEIARVLKTGGELILITPRTGKTVLIHRLRAALGLTLDHFGHKREGYVPEELEAMLLRSGLRPFSRMTYSKFFSEFFELLLNFAYIRFFSGPALPGLRDGRIKPSTGEEYAAQAGTLRAYAAAYPFLWLFCRMDLLLFFLRGNALVVRARKMGPAALTPPRGEDYHENREDA